MALLSCLISLVTEKRGCTCRLIHNGDYNDAGEIDSSLNSIRKIERNNPRHWPCRTLKTNASRTCRGFGFDFPWFLTPVLISIAPYIMYTLSNKRRPLYPLSYLKWNSDEECLGKWGQWPSIYLERIFYSELLSAFNSFHCQRDKFIPIIDYNSFIWNDSKCSTETSYNITRQYFYFRYE